MLTRDVGAELDADAASRARYNKDEHPIITRMVLLRIYLNHEFGSAFQQFDHELAQIELQVAEALQRRTS